MRTRTLLTALAAAVLAGAAPAGAAPLRLADTGATASRLVGDGGRYVGLVPGADGEVAVSVLDTTGARPTRTFVEPGCAPADLSGSTLLWSCGEVTYGVRGGRVTNVVSGARSPLPGPFGFDDPNTGPPAVSYARIGRRWAEVVVQGRTTYEAWIDRATGAVARVFDDAGRRQVDLDLPGLTRPLCAGVERPVVPDIFTRYGRLLERGPWYLSLGPVLRSTDERLVLQRCGRAPVTLRTSTTGTVTPPVLGDGFAAWAESSVVRGTRLAVRTLATGRTRRIGLATRTPQLIAAGPKLYALVEGRLLRVGLGRR